eukprot:3181924-Amphidinium_carterae.1
MLIASRCDGMPLAWFSSQLGLGCDAHNGFCMVLKINSHGSSSCTSRAAHGPPVLPCPRAEEGTSQLSPAVNSNT